MLCCNSQNVWAKMRCTEAPASPGSRPLGALLKKATPRTRIMMPEDPARRCRRAAVGAADTKAASFLKARGKKRVTRWKMGEIPLP